MLIRQYCTVAVRFQALGVDHRIGSLDFDTEANFIMIDEGRMEITSTWIAGRRVYAQV